MLDEFYSASVAIHALIRWDKIHGLHLHWLGMPLNAPVQQQQQLAIEL